MDGNGRWAKQKNHPRAFGHETGAQTAKTIINDCVKKEIPHLTLYTFSKENWSRPKEEIDILISSGEVESERYKELVKAYRETTKILKGLEQNF